MKPLVLLALLASPAAAEPLYDATVDTVFDIITTADPSAFDCWTYDGMAVQQMWDKRIDAEIHPQAHVFTLRFADGPVIEATVNPEFTLAEAEVEVARHALALGRLPLGLRAGWRRLGIHAGDASYSAGTGLSFVYTGRTDWLESFAHVEESLFHEGVHVTLGAIHDDSPGWRAAQAHDGDFLTGYAADNPDNEDLAETLLFAFGLQLGRMPPADADAIRAQVPARLAYIADAIDLVMPQAGANGRSCPAPAG